jgi:hypothetical protein
MRSTPIMLWLCPLVLFLLIGTMPAASFGAEPFALP